MSEESSVPEGTLVEVFRREGDKLVSFCLAICISFTRQMLVLDALLLPERSDFRRLTVPSDGMVVETLTDWDAMARRYPKSNPRAWLSGVALYSNIVNENHHPNTFRGLIRNVTLSPSACQEIWGQLNLRDGGHGNDELRAACIDSMSRDDMRTLCMICKSPRDFARAWKRLWGEDGQTSNTIRETREELRSVLIHQTLRWDPKRIRVIFPLFPEVENQRMLIKLLVAYVEAGGHFYDENSYEAKFGQEMLTRDLWKCLARIRNRRLLLQLVRREDCLASNTVGFLLRMADRSLYRMILNHGSAVAGQHLLGNLSSEDVVKLLCGIPRRRDGEVGGNGGIETSPLGEACLRIYYDKKGLGHLKEKFMERYPKTHAAIMARFQVED